MSQMGGYNSISQDEAATIVEKLLETERNIVTKGSRTGGGEGVTLFRISGRRLLNKTGEELSLNWLEKNMAMIS